MKKLTDILFLLTLAVMAIVLPSCAGEEECGHKTILATIIAPTCDTEGYTLHKCRDCDMEYKTDILPSTGHTLVESTVTATCTREGYTEYRCACGYFYRGGFVPPTDHSFTSSTVKPTCTKQGYEKFTCSCGYTYAANYVEPTGHTLQKQVHQPTCNTEGYTEYACTCGYSFVSDTVEPKGHTIVSQTTLPTCTEEGYTVNSCTCGYSYVSSHVAPLGHTLTSSVTPPDCENAGYTTYTCACTYSYRSDFVKPLGHRFESSVSKRPTGTEHGEITFSCDCGETYTNLILRGDVFEGAYVDGNRILAHGIDVSKWNGAVNWEEIKSLGIDFVIIRAGYSGTVDPNFEANYAGAKEVGLDVGAYYYTYADSVAEALEDAEEFAGWLAGKQFEYPVYLDMEDNVQSGLDPTLLSEMCTRFINYMQASGYFCGLYANYNWLTYIYDAEDLTPYFDVWFARYYDNTDQWRSEWGDCMGMWQYSETGTLGTHTGHFDLNVAFKDYPSLIKSLGYNGFSAQ